MKTLSGLTKCGLFVIAAFCFTAGYCELEHNVLFVPSYEKADMIILPGTEISGEDATKLREILKSSNAYFYSIQPYVDGVPQRAFGKLPIPRDFKCRTDKGEFGGFTRGTSRHEEGLTSGVSRKLQGLTRWTRVIGQGCQSRCTNQTSRRGDRGREPRRSSQDLVNAVKPILLKYQAE